MPGDGAALSLRGRLLRQRKIGQPLIKPQNGCAQIAQGLFQFSMNRPGFTGGQNSRRIAHHGTDTQQEDFEAVFT